MEWGEGKGGGEGFVRDKVLKQKKIQVDDELEKNKGKTKLVSANPMKSKVFLTHNVLSLASQFKDTNNESFCEEPIKLSTFSSPF